VIRPRLLLLALSIALFGAAAPAEAATYTDLDQFRADAGGRLVDWEDHAPGPVAVDHYKPRGMLLAATGQTDGHVFSPSSGNVTTVSFVVPDSGTTALTRGFGVEFSDPASGKLELLDSKGQVIQSVVPQTDFVGILLDDGRVAKARITGKPLDNFAYAEPMQDLDGDGVAANDPDADGDGIPNERDAFPLDKKETADTDGDGSGDNADSDDDNDGSPDTIEGKRGTDSRRADTDGDGITDAEDDCPVSPGEACSDVIPPVLAKLALRPAKFETGSKHGTRVSFRLSERATVTLRVLRVAGTRRPPVSGLIERRATAGTNFVKFGGRIGGRDLKPGRYVLVVSAEDGGGNLAFEQPRARFTVLG
jgi:thrombospondin type 3 repeat protein